MRQILSALHLRAPLERARTLAVTIAASTAAALVFAGATPAKAQSTGNATGTSTNMVVVELFTSQGCSSCPPADALMLELAQMEGVLPLSLHVDYWDYIGWKDSFAQARFTERQRAYARAAGHRTIYTPQMIVQGRDHVVGLKPMKLANHIRSHQAKSGAQVSIDFRQNGSAITVTGQSNRTFSAPSIVQLVHFLPSETVAIKRGENAGKSIEYSNIVTHWQVVGEWNGTRPLTLELPKAAAKDGQRSAIIVQAANTGDILAAAVQR